ncbi:MAG: hypothetical protein HZB50_17165 [Chloroflexi bacterium]|nr:hypothetical protein [Chloroflexota bacterium]
MSSYARFSFGNTLRFDTLNCVDPFIMTIFREQDKKIQIFHDAEDEGWELTNYKYSVKMSIIRQRLDVMGFSKNNAEKNFYEFSRNKINSLKEDLAECQEEEDFDYEEKDFLSQPYDQTLLTYREKIELFSRFGFNDWLLALERVVKEDLSLDGFQKTNQEEKILKYLLRYDGIDFPCTDIRYTLRLLADLAPDDSLVEYDYSSLVGECYSNNDKLVEISLNLLSKDYEVASKIIVLTEGTTDAELIEKSLHLLYPHLSDYYYFMNFKVSNVEGSASKLVHTVRAFVGSGIKNRTIALFDNDLAGLDEKANLSKTKIPPNIKVLAYPDLDFAKSYPAINPTGISYLDINGIACCLEMYFGSDILKTPNGFTPVRLRGDTNAQGKKQGVVEQKTKIQNEFRKKLKICRELPENISKMDWEPMRLLLDKIFNAFG